MKRFLCLLVIAVGGFAFAFPPIDFFPFGILSLGILGAAVLRPKLEKKHWFAVYGAGVGFFFFGCFWIAETAMISLVLMSLAEGLAILIFGLLFRFMVQHKRLPLPIWLALPLAWTAIEYFRSVWPLDGYPWLLLGYTLWKWPVLIQVADITGAYGLSFLLAMAAGLGIAVYRDPRFLKGVKTGVWVFAVLLLLVLGYGWIRPKFIEVERGPVLAAIQGNIPQELKDNRHSLAEVINRYKMETLKVFKPGQPPPQLVVWPETILPYLEEGKKEKGWEIHGETYSQKYKDWEEDLLGDLFYKLFSPNKTWFLSGAVSFRKEDDVEKNAAFLYDPSGKRRDSYYKTILVPGGEYLPWVEHVPFEEEIKKYVMERAGFLPDLHPGHGPNVMTIFTPEKSYKFGVQICFENIYGDYCRKFIKKGADFLINISNEGWFKTSSEFDQMLAMSVFRAVEMRRTLFRCTNTGISCLIGPLGGVPENHEKIVSKGQDRAVKGVLKATVPLCGSGSLYVQVGDLFAQILFYIEIILFLFLLFRRA